MGPGLGSIFSPRFSSVSHIPEWGQVVAAGRESPSKLEFPPGAPFELLPEQLQMMYVCSPSKSIALHIHAGG